MSTSFTDLRGAALLAPLLIVLLVSGCASRPDSGLGDASGERALSRHADQRGGAAAGDSDAEHVPPVPHDPAVRPIAEAATQEYFRGLQYLRNDEHARALVVFQSMTTRYPALSGPWVNIGLIQLHQEDWAAAEESLRQALATNVQNPYAHNALGVALREQGRFVEAKRHYLEAVALDPRYARAHFNLGVLAELYLQDLPSALDHFRDYQALQRQPDPTVANWIADLERRTPTLADRPREEP